MGYTTEFKGVLKFKNELTIPQLKRLNEMCESDFREEKTDFVPPADDNYICYIDLRLTKAMDGLEWTGAEKTYGMISAVNYILHEMRKQWPDFGLEGELLAQGDEMEDVWKLKFVNGQAVKEKMKLVGLIACPECGHKFVPGK